MARTVAATAGRRKAGWTSGCRSRCRCETRLATPTPSTRLNEPPTYSRLPSGEAFSARTVPPLVPSRIDGAQGSSVAGGGVERGEVVARLLAHAGSGARAAAPTVNVPPT